MARWPSAAYPRGRSLIPIMRLLRCCSNLMLTPGPGQGCAESNYSVSSKWDTADPIPSTPALHTPVHLGQRSPIGVSAVHCHRTAICRAFSGLSVVTIESLCTTPITLHDDGLCRFPVLEQLTPSCYGALSDIYVERQIRQPGAQRTGGERVYPELIRPWASPLYSIIALCLAY